MSLQAVDQTQPYLNSAWTIGAIYFYIYGFTKPYHAQQKQVEIVFFFIKLPKFNKCMCFFITLEYY